jgi:hypothetical protein
LSADFESDTKPDGLFDFGLPDLLRERLFWEPLETALRERDRLLECDLDLEREPDFCDFGDFRESTDFFWKLLNQMVNGIDFLFVGIVI